VVILPEASKVVILPKAIPDLILKRLRIDTTADGWDNHASLGVPDTLMTLHRLGMDWVVLAAKCTSQGTANIAA
jgi:hypothetical protein